MKRSVGNSVPMPRARPSSSTRLQIAANWMPMPVLLLCVVIVTFAQRRYQLGLLVEFDLLARIDDHEIGSHDDFVVMLATPVELASADDANDVAAGLEPAPEEDRIGGIGRGDHDLNAARALFGIANSAGGYTETLVNGLGESFARSGIGRVDLDCPDAGTNRAESLHLGGSLLSRADDTPIVRTDFICYRSALIFVSASSRRLTANPNGLSPKPNLWGKAWKSKS